MFLFAIAAVATGVPLLVLAAQRSQRRPSAGLPGLSRWHAFQSQYATTDKAALALVAVMAVVATVSFTSLLWWLGSSYQAGLPAGLYVRMPRLGWFSILAPGVVLGILVAVLATDLAMRLALGGRYGEYELAFGGGGGGRRGDRGMPLVTIIVAGLVTGLVILSVDSYSRFEEDRIVVNPFWGLAEHGYGYDNVQAVVQATHTRSKSREHPHVRYFILFTDGRQWCNEAYGFVAPSELANDAALIDFVCRKSGKPLTRVRHIEEFAR